MIKKADRIESFVFFLLLAMALIFAAGCGDDDDDDSSGVVQDDDDDAVDDDDVSDDDDDDVTDDDDDDDITDDDDDDSTEGPWEPSMVVDINEHAPIRDYDVTRGIIHLHSVYSHDACDNAGIVNGQINQRCFDQLRDAFCSTNQQYILLSDHKDQFAYYDFPEVLLYDEDRGDELLYDGFNNPYANHITCEDGNELILMAGSENRIMPLAITKMPDGTGQEREDYFGSSDTAAVESMQDDLDGLVFVNHSEGWETQDLLDIPIDGIEIYNLHANIDPGTLGVGLVPIILDVLHFLIPFADSGQSDLIYLAFLTENDIAVDHWDKMLAQRPTVGVMATDAHRNALPFPLLDGQRADSYHRMMRWFANYILLDDFSPEGIKEAVDTGRMYGAFQVFGEPMDFDFYADSDAGAIEMGQEVDLADSPKLVVNKPRLWGMDYTVQTPPEITMRIIQADGAGGIVVAEGDGETLEFTVTEAGAFRAEVRLVPHHLEQWLGDSWERFIREYPLIYANPIYVTP